MLRDEVSREAPQQCCPVVCDIQELCFERSSFL